MKKAVKFIALLLALSVLATGLGTVSFAADEEMYTFFSDDFESAKVGSSPATGPNLNQWNSKASSSESYAKVVEEGGTKALEFGRASSASGAGGPRYEKNLPANAKNKVTVAFDVKTNGFSFGIYLKDAASNKKILGITDVCSLGGDIKKSEFNSVLISFDFANKVYAIDINGKNVAKDKAIDASLSLDTFAIRFGTTLNPGETVLLDNVVMKINDKSQSSEAIEQAAEEAAKEILSTPSNPINKTTKAPSDYYTLFDYDFEGDKVGGTVSTGATAGKWHSKTTSSEAYFQIADDNGNKAGEFGFKEGSEGKGYPRLEMQYDITKNHIVTVEFDVRTNGQSFSLELHDSAASTKLFTVSDKYSKKTSVAIDTKNYVHIYTVLDFKKMTYSVMIGNEVVSEGEAIRSDLNFAEKIGIRFNNSINPGYWIRLDNVHITINDKEYAESLNQDIHSIDVEAKDGSILNSISKTHPRIHLNSFDTLKAKIESDSLCRDWYNTIIDAADTLVNSGSFVYNVSVGGNGDNILEISRKVMHMSYILSFAYQMTGNTAYKDRLYKEYVNVGNFPGWSIEEFLCTAEMCHAFAIGYDWLYYDWSNEERANILDIMTRQGFVYAVENYNGSPTGGTNWVNATHNWNLVCNGSMIIAAIAVSDERPDYANFFLEKAADSITKGLTPYAPSGAYPEGAGYWAYGTNYLTYTMSALESAAGEALTSRYTYYTAEGIKDTCDFLIYTNAMVGRFNYGDASSVMGGSPILYWYANKFNKPEYSWYMLNDEATKTYGKTDENWTNVLKILWYNPELSADSGSFALDKAYTSDHGFNGIFMRSSWTDENGIYVGLQGGYNRDNHMFLSQGNFLIEANGERWSTMRGSGNYDWSGYFSRGTNTSQRWKYYKTRAEGQNTLVINSGENADQEVDSVAKTVGYGYSDNEAFGILDMTDGYKLFGVNSLKRGVKLFDERSRILIQDEISAQNVIKSGYWFMHTDAEIQLLNGGKSAMLVQNGKKLYARIISNADNLVFTVMEAKPLATSPNPDVQKNVDYGHKLAIDFAGTKDLTLAVEFIPLSDGEAAVEENITLTPLSSWKTEDNSPSANTLMHNSVALFVDSPKAFDRSCVTLVDTANKDVTPVVINDRTLLPVRFVSEKFGAKVGWDEATQAVTVNGGGKLIKLAIGSNVMTVNGEERILDVPAQTLNDRTVIPLRALVEALGKYVFWDDRGLIIISDKEVSFDSGVVDKMVSLLSDTITVDGTELNLKYGKTGYDVYIPAYKTEAAVEAKTANAAFEPVISLGSGSAAVTIGNTVYNIRFVSDPSTYAFGDAAIGSVSAKIAGESEEEAYNTRYIIPEKITPSAAGNNAPENASDGDIVTQWTLAGEQWLEYDFGKTVTITDFAISVMKGAERVYKFDILYSADGVNWQTAYDKGETKMTGELPERYSLNTPVNARYVRYVGYGNSKNNWNSINELRFYENKENADTDEKYFETVFNGIYSYTYNVGEKKQIEVSALSNSQNPINASDLTVIYESTNPASVKVSPSGEIEVVGAGKSEIIITADFYGVSKTTKIVVNGK